MSPMDVILPDEVPQFFKMNSFGIQTKIIVKFMYKTFITFAKQITSIDDQESTFDTSITPIPLLLKPLPKPLRISFDVKPMLLRSISLFHSFCNTEKQGSSDINMQATITSY